MSTATPPGDAIFAEAAERFLAGAQRLIEAHHAANYPSIHVPTLSFEWGRRYVRIVATAQYGRSAWGFLDRTSGDVLMTHNWRSPAAHARGNIFDESGGLARVGPHGPEYLR